jgi:hypothetical protein
MPFSNLMTGRGDALEPVKFTTIPLKINTRWEVKVNAYSTSATS